MQHSTFIPHKSISDRAAPPLQASLNRKNRSDVFNVNLSSLSSFRAALSGIAKKTNVDLELQNSQGTIVAASRKRGRAAELIAVDRLEAGSYRLRATLKQGDKTKYRLSFDSTPLPPSTVTLDNVQTNPTVPNPAAPQPVSPAPVNPFPSAGKDPVQFDLGGNSAAAAKAYGKLGAAMTISDGLGNGDSVDWYLFQVGDAGIPSSRLNLSLTGDAGVYTRLYSADDLNNPLGTVVANAGSQNPLSSANPALAAGTYYVKVAPIATNGSANYSLNLSATDIADSAGNTATTARVINQSQPLNTSGQSFTATDFVGHGDAYDYYSFNTSEKTTLTIQFDRLNTGNFDKARIQYQLDKTDGQPSSLFWKNDQGASLSAGFDALASPSYTLTGTLEPGSYRLGLKSYFFDGDNAYRMTISTAP